MKYGRYEIIKEIGRGSMGVVYQAHDPNLDIQVALKVLRPDRVVSEAFVKRFLAEAKALGRLDHPNIVRVYNVDEAEGTVYIAMEFIEGESLTEVIQRKRLSPAEIIDLGVTAAEALDYAHQKGIVHRDIKPSNILIRPDGRLKITDFGIARIEDPTGHQQTQAGEILGTPAYMSPEQVESRPVDGRSDLFSLGIILYELSAGTRPFKGESLAAIFNSIIKENPAKITEVNPSIPSELSQTIMKCLNKTPTGRFDSGRTLASALKSSIMKKEPAAVTAQAVGKKSKTTGLVVAIVIVLAVIGGGAYFFTGKKTEAPPVEEKASLASLKVDSAPADANVFINGTFRGTTPVKLELPAKDKYEVRLTMSSYYDWEAQIQLKDGGETPLFVQLIPSEEARSQPEKRTMGKRVVQPVEKEKTKEAPAETVQKQERAESAQPEITDAVITKDPQPPVKKQKSVEQDLENLMDEMRKEIKR